MKAGAVDFIQKPLDEHRLVMAVMNALKADNDRNRMPETFAEDSSATADKLASLSKREADVLKHLLAGKPSREIAEMLCISIKTVEFHRANIREKLGVESLPELFRLVFNK